MSRPQPALTCAGLALALVISAASAGATTFTWKSAVSGLWSDGTNWDVGVPPGPGDIARIALNGTYTVTVGANANAQRVELGAATGAQTLRIGGHALAVSESLVVAGMGWLDLAGGAAVSGAVDDRGFVVSRGGRNTIAGTLRVRPGATLRLGTNAEPLGATDTLALDRALVNEGTITTWIANGCIQLGGLPLVNSAGALLTSASGTLTTDATLENAGTVAQRSYFRLILSRAGASHSSSGTLDIDSQGYLMLDGALQVNGGSLVNTGAITVGYNSQLLVRSGGELTLAPGTSLAGSGGSLIVDGGALHAGALSVDVDLELRTASTDAASLSVPAGRTLTLHDATLTGPATYAGAIVCEGAFVHADSLTSVPGSDLGIGAGATLQLAKAFTNHGLLHAWGGDGALEIDEGALVNAPDGTIAPTYWALRLRAALDNQGLVHPGLLTLDGPFVHTNSGTITLDGDGLLRIAQGGSFDPSAGVLQGTGTLEYDTSTVVGGHVVLPANTVLNDATVACSSLANPAGQLLDTRGQCLIPVPLHNHGLLRVAGFTYAQDTLVTGDSSIVVIEPAGELASLRGFTNHGLLLTTLNCCTTSPAFLTVLTGTLTNAPGGTLSVTNGWLHVSGALENLGDVRIGDDGPASPPSLLVLAGGGAGQVNRGTIETHAGDTLLVVGGGLENEAAGTVSGVGTIRMLAGWFVNAGRIDPGFSWPGLQDHVLKVMGNLSLSPTSVLHLDLGAAYECDVLLVSDTLRLGGTLEAAAPGGYAPLPGDSLPLVVASVCLDSILTGTCTNPVETAALLDTFATVSLPTLGEGQLLDLRYRAGLVALIVADSTTGTLLSLLQCSARADGVELRWRFGNPASIASVQVERASEAAGPWEATPVERWRDGETEVALDRAALDGGRYLYRIVALQRDGTRRVFGPIEVTSIAVVAELAFGPPAPNPTNAATRFDFALPRAAHVQLRLLDVLGREVAMLVDDALAAGRYQAAWSGDLGGRRAPAGVYFACLRAEGRELKRRVVVVR